MGHGGARRHYAWLGPRDRATAGVLRCCCCCLLLLASYYGSSADAALQ
eukprot:COSAG01_NODE_45018_length_413_cov_1.308917_1_plen_47_part_01